jgi:glyoxylase-like metal-dependent hydrolase (beta-lactamase superfamily II)
MSTSLLFPLVETPDGFCLPGPHSTSGAGEIYPGLSSTVAVIVSGGEAMIIDSGFRTLPGYPSGPLDRICEILDRPGLRVRYLVQTHWHMDHVGNSRYLRERYGAEVVCHEIEKPAVEDPFIASRPEYLESFGGDLEEIAADLGLSGPEDLLTPEEIVRKHWNFPVKVDRVVADGDRLPLGDLEIEVIHTPGHSPGHISLYNPTTNSLYLGDVWFFPAPCHYWPAGNADDHMNSIERCLEVGAEYLYPGHHLPRAGFEDVRVYLVDLRIKQWQLMRNIKVALCRFGPLTLTDIHAEALPVKSRFNYSHDGWYTFSLACVHSHLRRMHLRGEVDRVERGRQVLWAITRSARLPEEQLHPDGGYQRDAELIAEAYSTEP